MRNRFRIWMVLKVKTSSSRPPFHIIEVSVRPSSNRSVVPSPSAPTQATPKSIESGWIRRLRHQRQCNHTCIAIHRCRAGAEVAVVNEPFTIATRSGGVDHLPDGLPQVVLRGGEQVEQGRRVVLGAEELADDGIGIL